MRRHIILLLILLITASFASDEAQQYYEKGLQSYHGQDYMKAIGEFTSAISLKQDFADAYYQRALAKDMLGKQAGFFSPDLCFDLIMAMKMGHGDAGEVLRKKSNIQCNNAETMLIEPDMVFCADLSSHVLFKMPDGSNQLQYVAYLNLFDNRFSDMPEELFGYKYLVHLDMSSNALTKTSNSISKLSWLVELNFNKNQITQLSPEVCKLQHLRMLYMRHNHLTSIPEEIGNLQALEELDLALNQITSLPASLSSLSNLKKLVLVGNPIPPAQIEALKAKLPRTQIYF